MHGCCTLGLYYRLAPPGAYWNRSREKGDLSYICPWDSCPSGIFPYGEILNGQLSPSLPFNKEIIMYLGVTIGAEEIIQEHVLTYIQAADKRPHCAIYGCLSSSAL